MFYRCLRVFALLFTGFAGGAMAPWVLGWIQSSSVTSGSDAVSIANTYIVFTTLIFVGVTVLLAIAGYVFTQHFSASKELHQSELLDELKEKIKGDEYLGIKLARAMLENSDVRRHLQEVLAEKVDEIIRARLADSQADAVAAARNAAAVEALVGQLTGNGKEDSNGKGK